MIWFDVQELEKRISRNELSDKDYFNYVLANSILLAIIIATFPNFGIGGLQYLSCITVVIITVWGMKTLYKANNTGDGQDFFKRLFAVFWVIGFKLYLLFITSLFLLGFIEGYRAMNNNGSSLTVSIFWLFKTGLAIIIYGALYIFSAQSFTRVSTKNMS